jgi:hypothetical protein
VGTREEIPATFFRSTPKRMGPFVLNDHEIGSVHGRLSSSSNPTMAQGDGVSTERRISIVLPLRRVVYRAVSVGLTRMMHKFWVVPDPMMHQLQMIMFMKNMAMLGRALLITQFGAGPWSLDSRRK